MNDHFQTLVRGVALLAALPLSSVAAQELVPDWTRAPDCVRYFEPSRTDALPANQALSVALSRLAYPDQLGISPHLSSSDREAAFARKVRAVLEGPMLSVSGGRLLRSAGWGFDTVTTFRIASTDTEGYIASNERFTVVVYRGTEIEIDTALRDVVSDLAFHTLPSGAGGVHAGFWDAATSARYRVAQQLRDRHGYAPYISYFGRLYPNPRARRPIWVVGDSLGAAVAVLSGYQLKTTYRMPVVGSMTSGQPMVGDARFARSYADRGLVLHRLVNNCDVVAQAFGELNYLVEDFGRAAQGVSDRATASIPEPIRTPVRLLVGATVGPVVLAGSGLSGINDLLNSAGLSHVHFGTLHYFDRFGRLRVGASLATRRGDRVQTYVDGVWRLLRRFLAPPPPPPWDLVAWSRYLRTLAEIADRAWQTLTRPGPFLAEVGEVFGQLVADHDSAAYLRLIRNRVPSTVRARLPRP